MTFDEAFKELLKGKYVTRSTWNDGSYLVLLPGIPNIWKIITTPQPNVGGWPATKADYQADDYVFIPLDVIPTAVPEVQAA